MLNSFIITPKYFRTPENPWELVQEPGIEDRYKRAFEKTDPNFTIYKDDWSDGVIRYTVDNEVKFYGIQECKRSDNRIATYHSRIVQGLAYVASWLNQFPKAKDKFKVLILPTDERIDVVYLEDILKSSFWTQFCFYWLEHRRHKKCSASNFYEKSMNIQALIWQYEPRFKTSHRLIGHELDLKNVTAEILRNCYECN